MLTEYVHEQTQAIDRERLQLAQSRPRYDRSTGRNRSRLRDFLRGLAFAPAKASPGRGGGLPDVVIRPAAAMDARAVARLAEANERRVPSGLVLVAEVDAEVVAALPVDDSHVLADLWRPTGDVVQLLELRSGQLRAARFENVA
jgi:hypothetical protein